MDNVVLKQHVLDELNFDPRINAANIGIMVDHGVVSLTGEVDTYGELVDAENAAWRVSGVKAIAQEMRVRRGDLVEPDDESIAGKTLDQLCWNVRIPEDALQVRVMQGWVTITGNVEWQFQKAEITDTVKRVPGVLGLTNQVLVKPVLAATDIEKTIRDALLRTVETQVDTIRVVVDAGSVTLEGRVRTPDQRRVVADAAWSVPGVHDVIDHLTV